MYRQPQHIVYGTIYAEHIGNTFGTQLISWELYVVSGPLVTGLATPHYSVWPGI